jgi:hypothetical protein
VIGRRWARGIAAAKEVLDRAGIKAVEAAEDSFAVYSSLRGMKQMVQKFRPLDGVDLDRWY